MSKAKTKKISIIEKMVALNLSGQGSSDYQKAKALDVLFNTIREAESKKMEDECLSIASKRIERFLSQQYKRNYLPDIEIFMSLFNTLLQKEPWNGDLKRIYRDRFLIRDTYLWNMDLMIHEKAQAKKQKAGEKK